MAIRTLKVSVTQEDIDRGEPGNDKACPIALAALRACIQQSGDENFKVRVGRLDIDLCRGSTSGTVELSDFCKFFVNEFDEGELVEPFQFDLELTEDFDNQILA